LLTAGEHMHKDWCVQGFSAFPRQRCDWTGCRAHLIICSSTSVYLAAVLLCAMQYSCYQGWSSWPHYKVDQITNVEESTSSGCSAGIPEVQ